MRKRARAFPLVVFVALIAASVPAAAVMADGPGEVAVLVEQAHAARLAGRLDEAASLLVRARVADPNSLAPVREACEVGLAREENGSLAGASREACHRAMVMKTQPEDFRNEVASLMSPSQHPSLDDLATASLAADAALRAAPDQPWGYLARCDLARRLGSADVMQACLADLQRVAPSHPETLKMIHRLAEGQGIWRWLAGMLALSMLGGTLIHSIVRGARAQRRGAAAAKAMIPLTLFVLCGLFAPGLAWAEADPRPDPARDLSRIKIDDAHPEASLPTAAQQLQEPLQFGYLLQDLTERAERASLVGDHQTAARYYRALTQGTTTSLAPRKLCEELEAAGDVLNAIVACRTAITRQGTTPADFARFVRLVLAEKGTLPVNEKAELETQIEHLSAELAEAKRGEPRGAGIVADWRTTLVPRLRCEVAVRFHDVSELETCTSELASAAPNDPQTVALQWALAVEKDDHAGALALIERARNVGMSPDGLARMERQTSSMRQRHLGRILVVVAAAGLLATLAIYEARRRATL